MKCENKKFGTICQLVCKPGYNETPDYLMCLLVKEDEADWVPIGNSDHSCILETDQMSVGQNIIYHSWAKLPLPYTYVLIRFIAYTGKFSTSRQLPMWSVNIIDSLNYFMTDNDIDRKNVGTFIDCPFEPVKDLQNFQINSNFYDQGHLVPFNILKFSKKAAKSSFWRTNMSPQLKDINKRQWKTLEAHIETFSRNTKGEVVIITGTCPILNNQNNAPKCIWKLICFKNKETKNEAVIGFYHYNSYPQNEVYFENKSLNDIRNLLDLQYLNLEDAWEAAINNQNSRNLLSAYFSNYYYFDRVNIANCKNMQSPKSEDLKFWNLNKDSIPKNQ